MRILREWKKFENQVLDPRAGPVQRAEMRSAFIAGAFVALETLDPAKSPAKLHEECLRLYRELAVLIEDECSRCKSRQAKTVDTRPTNGPQRGTSE